MHVWLYSRVGQPAPQGVILGDARRADCPWTYLEVRGLPRWEFPCWWRGFLRLFQRGQLWWHHVDTGTPKEDTSL